MQKKYAIPRYGVVAAFALFIFQHALYLLGNALAGVVGNEPFCPKTVVDSFIPVIPVFMIVYMVISVLVYGSDGSVAVRQRTFQAVCDGIYAGIGDWRSDSGRVSYQYGQGG